MFTPKLCTCRPDSFSRLTSSLPNLKRSFAFIAVICPLEAYSSTCPPTCLLRPSPFSPLKVHRRVPLYECLVLDYGSSDSFIVARRPSGKSFVAMAVSSEEKQVRLNVSWKCVVLAQLEKDTNRFCYEKWK